MRAISPLNGGSLKLDKFTYLDISVSFTESDIIIHQAKAWIAIDRLSIIKKSDLSDKIKRFFQSSGFVNTTLWMHPMDDDKTHREKASLQPHKNATNYIEQFLEAIPREVVAVQPFASHL